MVRKIIIIGAGPTGLGAAYHLQELGYRNWEIYEKNGHIGGLSASFKDNKGFTWDIGGHVLFSHYEYVGRLVDKLLENEYLAHQRDAWIWLLNSWVPYPFQNNIRYLPKDAILECLLGLIRAKRSKNSSRNFQEWILSTFGEGIARYFMLPYNSKVWAHPLKSMDKHWIAERVSVIDLEMILRNVIFEQDEREWGPNSQFKFPLHGGTGGLFSRFMPYIKDHLILNEDMGEIDIDKKMVRFSSGREATYDILVNTTPLDQFVFRITPKNDSLAKAAKWLKHNGVFSIGIGIKKPCPSQKCWVYFPEDNCCFYRTTYFSNYSPNNVPDPQSFYSLICETSCSEHRPEDESTIIERTVDGLVNTGIITESDRRLIETTHVIQAEYAYPIPTLERDKALGVIMPYLEERGIFSRGRFGAWKYEIGNMDHSIMQGVEVINNILGRGDECKIKV
ncbi:MAG: NAD(P)-binding protein [Nitrososphaerota archaeon]|nr:NAD(P)-binding protein [Nitrososphaerota archaeon]